MTNCRYLIYPRRPLDCEDRRPSPQAPTSTASLVMDKRSSKTGLRWRNCIKCNKPKEGNDQLMHWCYNCYLKSEELRHDREKYREFCQDTYFPKKYMFRQSESDDEDEKKKGK